MRSKLTTGGFGWAVLYLTHMLAAQTPATAVRTYTSAHKAELVSQFTDLLSIPNVATDPVNLRRNADRLVEMLRKRGVESRLLAIAGAPPVVFGRIDVPGARHTIVLYAPLRRTARHAVGMGRRFTLYSGAARDRWGRAHLCQIGRRR